MKMRKCFGLVLALSVAVSSLNTPALAVESQSNAEPISAIERASGYFSETVSAGKVKKLGSGISLQTGETVYFKANYSPSSASVDFGVVDSNNTFTYINATTGSVDGGVMISKSGQYTPAIRNNSSDSIYVSGSVESYKIIQ